MSFYREKFSIYAVKMNLSLLPYYVLPSYISRPDPMYVHGALCQGAYWVEVHRLLLLCDIAESSTLRLLQKSGRHPDTLILSFTS